MKKEGGAPACQIDCWEAKQRVILRMDSRSVHVTTSHETHNQERSHETGLFYFDLIPLHGPDIAVDLEHAHGPDEVGDGVVDRVEPGEVGGQRLPRPPLQPALEPRLQLLPPHELLVHAGLYQHVRVRLDVRSPPPRRANLPDEHDGYFLRNRDQVTREKSTSSLSEIYSVARLGLPGVRGVEFPPVASTRPWKSSRRRRPGTLPPSAIAGGAAATSSCLRGRRQVRYRCAMVGVRKMPRKKNIDYSWKSVLFHMHDFSTMIQIFFCPGAFSKRLSGSKADWAPGVDFRAKAGDQCSPLSKMFPKMMLKIGGLISC